jgi:hypothetical protein
MTAARSIGGDARRYAQAQRNTGGGMVLHDGRNSPRPSWRRSTPVRPAHPRCLQGACTDVRRSDWVSDEMATETRRERASSRLVGTPRHLGRRLVSAELRPMRNNPGNFVKAIVRAGAGR